MSLGRAGRQKQQILAGGSDFPNQHQLHMPYVCFETVLMPGIPRNRALSTEDPGIVLT